MGNNWLIDACKPPTKEGLYDLEGIVMAAPGGNKRAALAAHVPSLAVRIPELIIHNTKKWFGGADIRLDALVVHGHAAVDDSQSVYLPGTFKFKGVKDHERLPIGKPGLLIYFGKPLYFLDLFVMVSRDAKDAEDLSALLLKNMKAPEMKASMITLLGLAVAAPQAAAIAGALGAAVVVGDFARQIVEHVTGTTIGLFRVSYLQVPDGFGVGKHPEAGVQKVMDFSFSHEVVIAEKAP